MSVIFTVLAAEKKLSFDMGSKKIMNFNNFLMIRKFKIENLIKKFLPPLSQQNHSLLSHSTNTEFFMQIQYTHIKNEEKRISVDCRHKFHIIST